MEQKKDIFDYLKPVKINLPDEAYFNKLAHEVISAKSTKIIPLFHKPIFWLSSAAAIIVMVFIINNDWGNPSIENPLVALKEIPEEDIFRYVEKNINDFDTEMFCELIPIGDIQEEEKLSDYNLPIEEKYESSINMEEISPEDILNYFQNQEIDLFELNEINELNF